MPSCCGRSPVCDRNRPMRYGALVGVVAAGACGPTAFIPPPPSPQRVYAIGEVDERPEIVLTPPLHYPAGGSDGVVVVRVVIDSAGNPEPATAVVVQGSDSTLNAAARTLLMKTLFRPGRVRGRGGQALIEGPVEFSAASVPPVTLHIAGDVYGETEVQERPQLPSGPPLTDPAPLP